MSSVYYVNDSINLIKVDAIHALQGQAPMETYGQNEAKELYTDT